MAMGVLREKAANYSINCKFHESGAVVVARDIHSPVGARRLQLFVKF